LFGVGRGCCCFGGESRLGGDAQVSFDGAVVRAVGLDGSAGNTVGSARIAESQVVELMHRAEVMGESSSPKHEQNAWSLGKTEVMGRFPHGVAFHRAMPDGSSDGRTVLRVISAHSRRGAGNRDLEEGA